MKIENFKIDSIIPYEFNSKLHDEDQVNKIANSIKEFGFNQPLVIDENNIIVVGHGRYLAAKKLDLIEIPCIQLKDLSEGKKKAYRLIDNKLNELSTWHRQFLDYDLKNLEEINYDLSKFGFITDINVDDAFDSLEESQFEGSIKDNKYLFKIDCLNKENLSTIQNFFHLENANIKNITFDVFTKLCLR